MGEATEKGSMVSLGWGSLVAPVGLAISVFVVVLGCENNPSGYAGQAAEDEESVLEYQAWIEPGETLPNLPVVLFLKVHNKSGVEQVYRKAKLGGGITVSPRYPDGSRGAGPEGPFLVDDIMPYSDLYARFDPSEEFMLKPGEKYTHRVWLSWGPKFSLSNPGQYRLEVNVVVGGPSTLQGRLPTRDLEPISLSVVQTSDDDEEARKLFMSQRIAGLFRPPLGERRFPWNDGQNMGLERLVSEHGETAYGKYARYVLACCKALPAFRGRWTAPETLTEEMRLGLQKAIELNEAILADGPPDDLRRDILLDLGRYHWRVGEMDKAREVLAQLEGEERSDTIRALRELTLQRVKE